MHDIQAEVIDTKTELNELYNDLFLSYSNSADSSYVNGVKIYWYNEGCYTFTSNGFTYSATENTVQASCVDFVSRINGDLGGQLVGGTHRIEKGTRIGDAIWAVLRDETEFKKYSIDYWSRTVPHDLDYDTGSTVWDILSELRDLYYPFEMYFDDDVFVCKEIPSGFDDPPVLDPEIFEKLVTNDGESATVDYAAVRNCVEVFGATIEADGAATVKGWSGTNKTINLVLNATESTWKSETKVSFVAPANVEAAKTDKNGNVTSGAMTVVLTFTWKYKDKDGNEQVGSETKTSTLYRSLTDANGSDIIQDPGCIKATKYYVLQWNPNTGRIYFLGQQQSHAMAKLVDEIPATKEIEAQKAEDNCDNMAFICVNDPNNIDDLYNARLSIEKIGRRTEILSGGDYENYTTDDAAMEVCQYELWKRARLTDGLSVTTRLVPWLDVNEKIQYAAKYLGGKTPVDWIIKSISMNLGEGTMSLSMSRYYPYYTYIVNNKYTFYQDNLFDKYFPELTATTADEQ